MNRYLWLIALCAMVGAASADLIYNPGEGGGSGRSGDTFPAWTDYALMKSTQSWVMAASTVETKRLDTIVEGDASVLNVSTYAITFSSTGLCTVIDRTYLGAIDDGKSVATELWKNGTLFLAGSIIHSAKAGGEMVSAASWVFNNDAATNRYLLRASSDDSAASWRNTAAYNWTSVHRMKNEGE